MRSLTICHLAEVKVENNGLKGSNENTGETKALSENF